MAEDIEPRERGRRNGRSPWPRLLLVIGLLLLGLGFAAFVWLGQTALHARDELTAAQVSADQLRIAVGKGDSPGAQANLLDAQQHADNAVRLTDDMVWRAVESMPLIGRTPRAIAETTVAVDQVSSTVLPTLLGAVQGLDVSSLRQGNSISLAPLVAAVPGLDISVQRLEAPRERLAGVDLDWVMEPVADAVRTASAAMNDLDSQLNDALDAARLIPPMLGQNGTRRYLMVFQNEAEARGTGGLFGAYAVILAHGGHVSVDSIGTDADLHGIGNAPVDLGPAYTQLYGQNAGLWANVNLSAHFPYAARNALALWQRQFPQRLDGVVAVDPVLLGYLLNATKGAVLPDGTRLSGDSIAELVMKDIYALYPSPTQNASRKTYLVTIASTAMGRLLGGSGDSGQIAAALAQGVGEGRLLVYSTRPEEEQILASRPLGGVIDTLPGPSAVLALNNLSGSKIDYYVNRSLAYQTPCTVDASQRSMTSTITVTMTDTAPSTGLPPYAAYRLDKGPANGLGRGGDGSVLNQVLVYGSMGSHLVSAHVDGGSLQVQVGVDGAAPGRPVFTFPLELKAGQTRTVTLVVDEPASTDDPQLFAVPGAQPSSATVAVASCR